MSMEVGLSLSLAANVLLVASMYKYKYKLRSAVHLLIEVGAGRAEVIDLGDRVAVKHKVIKTDNNVTL